MFNHRIKDIVYYGMDWLCPKYDLALVKQLRAFYGNITASNIARYVTSIAQTGDLRMILVSHKLAYIYHTVSHSHFFKQLLNLKILRIYLLFIFPICCLTTDIRSLKILEYTTWQTWSYWYRLLDKMDVLDLYELHSLG